jgi:hypothetical protein
MINKVLLDNTKEPRVRENVPKMILETEDQPIVQTGTGDARMLVHPNERSTAAENPGSWQ